MAARGLGQIVHENIVVFGPGMRIVFHPTKRAFGYLRYGFST